jgi:aminoglycoside phosphotransferase (APT) family kinase protein
MPGGWSPGSADVVTAADGGRAFVKTADARVDARSAALHRQEATTLRLLDGRCAPRLLGIVDEPPWVAVVVEAIDGRHPDPASSRDTAAVLDAVDRLPEAPPGAGLPRIEDVLSADALGWRRLREDGAALPPGVRDRLPALEALAARLPEALHGGSVVHLDLRVDNALIDGEGRGRLVDWPSAVVGARWVDAVTYLLDVRHLGGSAQEGLRHPVLQGVPADGIDVLLAVLGAYFLDSARLPEPPALVGLRAYQRAQGLTVLDWLQERLPAPR